MSMYIARYKAMNHRGSIALADTALPMHLLHRMWDIMHAACPRLSKACGGGVRISAAGLQMKP